MTDPDPGVPRGDAVAAPIASVAVVIAAKNERRSVAATVRAARGLTGVDLVVVVDDGSTDGTAAVAGAAGAHVLRHGRNRGKGAAMETGAAGVRLIEELAAASGIGAVPRHLLFLDADLGDTAAAADPLIRPVRAGAADMTTALLPPSRSRIAGQGFVVRLAREGIRRATGWEPEQPLSGQRCLTRAAFEAARPLDTGFGVEVALTIDLLRAGVEAVEVEVPMAHRPNGNGALSQVHRARQFRDVGRALAVRALRPAAARGLRRLGQGARGLSGNASEAVADGMVRGAGSVRRAINRQYPRRYGR